MARPVRALPITAEQRGALQRLVQRPTATQREVRRARIILERADGLSQADTARRVRVNRPVVAHGERRFGEAGLAGLADAQGRGRKPSVALETKAAIVSRATQPPAGRTRWSVRSMAKVTGVSKATVQRLWAANAIKPPLTHAFKLSNDPQFEAKFWDAIGLYRQPPDKALVLCCDERSRCQALERTQPGRPLGIGHVRARTHDSTRHGTNLLAALSYLDGKVFSQTAARPTHQPWLAFLKPLDQDTPRDLALHLILDNDATHKHLKVQSWIDRRNLRHRRQHGGDRIVLHCTPTASSWLNASLRELVERFFRDLTEAVVREGSFASLRELVGAIEAYLAEHNLAPKRSVWSAQGEAILANILRARTALQQQTIA